GVVSRHPVVGGPVGPWLAVASPARRRAIPHRRRQHVAGPSREWRHPRLFCHDASFPLAAPRHARADGVALSAAATRPAVRQAMARTHALAIPRQVRPEVTPPAAISVLERTLACTREDPPERRGCAASPRRGCQPRQGFRSVGPANPDRTVRTRSPSHGHRGARGRETAHPISRVAALLSRRGGGWTGAGLPRNGGNLGRG